MKFPLEYHSPVRRSVPASLALLGMFFLPSVLLSAQVNSSAASSGGHSFSSSAPSYNSAGHSGYAPGNTSIPSSTNSSHSVGTSPHSTSGSQGVHHNPPHSASGSSGVVYYPYLYAVPYPYVADDNSANNTDAPGDNDAADYQGGPTIFDRRGSGPDSYIPPVSAPVASARDGDNDNNEVASLNSDPPIPTMLVFKDGHLLEIDNYAIVSQTLYDLTPGHPRKIALADLDLPATEKQNDDRGVTFQLPPTAQAN